MPVRLLFAVLSCLVWYRAMALAGPAEDQRYVDLVAKAMVAPAAADFGGIREAYRKSRFYRGYESDPLALAATELGGGKLTDEQVDKAIHDGFALPGIHVLAIRHFGAKLGSERKALHVKAMVALVEAIAKTGSGISEAEAFKVLVPSEEYLLVSVLKAKSEGQALVPGKDGKSRYDVHSARLSNGKVVKLWFNVTPLFGETP